MQKIIIEIADNGIIKTVIDDNINAAGERFESKVVYDLEATDSVETKMKLLYELSEDMGMELGNSKQSNQIQIVCDWGEHYKPEDLAEVEARIVELETELAGLKAMLK